MSKHPAVLFTEPNEFVAELVRRPAARSGGARDRPRDEGGAPGDERDDHAGDVEAAAIVDGRCVRLRHLCGELWGMDADEQVQRRASELVRQLESELIDGGLEVRAGVYDED